MPSNNVPTTTNHFLKSGRFANKPKTEKQCTQLCCNSAHKPTIKVAPKQAIQGVFCQPTGSAPPPNLFKLKTSKQGPVPAYCQSTYTPTPKGLMHIKREQKATHQPFNRSSQEPKQATQSNNTERNPQQQQTVTHNQLDNALARALKVTQKRIVRVNNKLQQNNLNEKDKTRFENTKQRLEKRLLDIKALPLYLNQNNLRFQGFKGWDKTNVNRCEKYSNISQFESVFAKNEQGHVYQIPFDSRIKQFKGQEVDLLNKPIKHNNHFHDNWQTASLISALNTSIKWQMGQDDEGCPCCVAGLDFDEFAAAIKEISKSNVAEKSLFSFAEVSNAQHWGLVLGVAAPFGLIGLAAAIRNIKGSFYTQQNLKKLIQGLSQDIQAAKKAGLVDDAIKLEAFKKCLQYSKYDADFNLVVPGLVNGAASTLVLSTAFLAHPFALVAIGAYAAGQIIRNTGDLVKASVKPEKIKKGDNINLITGKQKVNQIQKSKFRFYLTNTVGFGSFAGGAGLTLASVLGLPLFGLGATTLPIGLALLGAGAASTGIMNNIWPKKFKPRNGDLGIAREKFNTTHDVLEEISSLQTLKKMIQAVKPALVESQRIKKFGLKILTAMPELRDFLPKRIANRITAINQKYLPFLPPLGNQATEKKHELNIKLAHNIHHTQEDSLKAIKTRLSFLTQLPGNQSTSEASNDIRALTAQTWALLVKQKMHSSVIQSWFEDGVLKQNIDGTCPGLTAETKDWIKFNFDDFIQNCSKEQLNELNVAIDFYLYFKLEKTLRYRLYGLNDFFWSWKKQQEKQMTQFV